MKDKVDFITHHLSLGDSGGLSFVGVSKKALEATVSCCAIAHPKLRFTRRTNKKPVPLGTDRLTMEPQQ
ncbi:MAG: hypothetical protein ICV55_14650 [Coleofasciculus sp. C3-bin4]|nr:hypothetical protein [Coleofasciculus sp. C3-bin4]